MANISDEINMISQYRVYADRKTGEWIGEPEYVGEVDPNEWLQRNDTEDAHYDTYEYSDSPLDNETRAIEVVWRD